MPRRCRLLPPLLLWRRRAPATRPRRRAEDAAAAAAQKSFDLGPKVGALCAKNLQTLIEAGNAQANQAMMTDAKQKMIGCKVPAPNRF